MIVHKSTYEEKNNWIPIDKKLPPFNKRVKLCYIQISDWNIDYKMWETTGWIRKDNTFSISIDKKQNIENFKYYGLKPTHWKSI